MYQLGNIVYLSEEENNKVKGKKHIKFLLNEIEKEKRIDKSK